MLAGMLQPLQVRDVPWLYVFIDLITQLPWTRKGHDATLVFVDGLANMVHFAPTRTDVSGEGVA